MVAREHRDIRDAASRFDDEIGGDAPAVFGVDDQAVRPTFETGRLVVGDDVDVGVFAGFDNDVHHVGIEVFQHAFGVVQDSDLFGTGASGDVGKFKGDVAAADEYDAIRKFRETEEVLAVVRVLGTGDVGAAWGGTRRDDDSVSGKLLLSDGDCVRAGELRTAAKGCNACGFELLYFALRDAVEKSVGVSL